MNDDGTMARMPDLVPFAQRHGLKIGTIEDLIAYRLKHDRIVQRVLRKPVESSFGGAFDLVVYETTVEPGEHMALVKGDVSKEGPVLVRVHAVDPLVDLTGVDAGASGGSLIERSMRTIAREGRGVVVLIRDIRPKAMTERIERANPPANAKDGGRDRRQVEIGVGSQILRDLGVSDMVLLTNSPAHVYVGLEAFGLRITGTRAIE